MIWWIYVVVLVIYMTTIVEDIYPNSGIGHMSIKMSKHFVWFGRCIIKWYNGWIWYHYTKSIIYIYFIHQIHQIHHIYKSFNIYDRYLFHILNDEWWFPGTIIHHIYSMNLRTTIWRDIMGSPYRPCPIYLQDIYSISIEYSGINISIGDNTELW